MVLLILALVWAIFLVPQLVRARTASSPADSIGAFRKQLSVLERTSPASDGSAPLSAASPSGVPLSIPTRSEVRRRRRDVLVGLGAAALVTFLLYLVTGASAVLVVHVVVDVLLALYVFFLARARALAEERGEKVRYLPRTAAPDHPVLSSAAR